MIIFCAHKLERDPSIYTPLENADISITEQFSCAFTETARIRLVLTSLKPDSVGQVHCTVCQLQTGNRQGLAIVICRENDSMLFGVSKEGKGL